MIASSYEFEADVYEDPQLPMYSSMAYLERGEGGFLHWHDAVEILYCMEGSGIAVSGSRRLRLEPGSMAVIHSGQLHDFYTPDSDCRYGVLLLARSLVCPDDLPSSPVQTFLKDAEAAAQVEGIMREHEEKRPYYRAEIRARIARLFVSLQRRYPGEEEQSGAAEGRKTEVTKAVTAYIRRHYAEPISVDDICAAVSFSRSYVCHAFREVTGKTIVEYIRMVRCAGAHALLAEGHASVAECARQSGFQNPSYFSRIYRREMGLSPSEHKRDAQE